MDQKAYHPPIAPLHVKVRLQVIHVICQIQTSSPWSVISTVLFGPNLTVNDISRLHSEGKIHALIIQSLIDGKVLGWLGWIHGLLK